MKPASGFRPGRVAFATRQDMAEAIAQVLTTPGHERQTYDLAGTQTYSFAEGAAG